MKRTAKVSVWLFALLVVIATTPPVFAATNYVAPGESIQAAVTAAKAGDTIIIFGGTYGESVTVDKQISLLRLAGQSVHITGNVTLQGISAAAATPMIVSNVKIGGDGSKKLIVNNCTNVVVDNVDLTAGGFTASGSLNVLLGNSTIAKADMASSTVTFSRDIVNDFVRMNNTGATNRSLNILQCTITNNYVQVSGGLGRLLYSEVQRISQDSTADTVIIGNLISTDKFADSCIVLSGGGRTVIRNNEITHLRGWSGYYRTECNGVQVDNCEAQIANNYIHDVAPGSRENYDNRDGICVLSNTKKVEIVGNVFWNTGRSVWAAYDNVIYRYNNDVDGLNRHGGGVIAEGIIAQDPLFVSKTSGNYQLSAGSPCINAGPPEPWFNDRDGTRNDIGLFGGAAYDPEGKTTDKPITFLLQATPLTVIKGFHTNLTFSSGGIVIGK